MLFVVVWAEASPLSKFSFPPAIALSIYLEISGTRWVPLLGYLYTILSRLVLVHGGPLIITTNHSGPGPQRYIRHISPV